MRLYCVIPLRESGTRPIAETPGVCRRELMNCEMTRLHKAPDDEVSTQQRTLRMQDRPHWRDKNLSTANHVSGLAKPSRICDHHRMSDSTTNQLENALLEAIHHARAHRLREEALSLALTLECVRRQGQPYEPAPPTSPRIAQKQAEQKLPRANI